MKMQNSLKLFATSNDEAKNLFEVMIPDYWNHYSYENSTDSKKAQFATVDKNGEALTLDDKHSLVNSALIKEALRRTGNPYLSEEFARGNIQHVFNDSNFKDKAFAVVIDAVDMIIPNTIMDSISLYSDVRNIPFGDTAQFDVESNDLFTVSQIGNAQRNSHSYKQYKGTKTINPVNHALTVYVDLYRVLAGKESLAKFVVKVIRSMETQMRNDVYDSFASMAAALPTTATTGLQIAGYTQAGLTRLCNQVTAWNGGNKAVIVGTNQALATVLPNDANYRYTLDDPYMTLGYVRKAFGFDVFEIPQVADYATEWGLRVANDNLWILSPSSQKFVKLVMEGSTINITDNVFQNADLSQKTTMQKRWGVGIASNAVAGRITI